MSQRPQRTCIGCRGVFAKGEVVRIVAGSDRAVIDYRERLPGRAAYVCPRRTCIEQALGRGRLGRSLRKTMFASSFDEFLSDLMRAMRDRIASLLTMAGKAGKASPGFSAVEDSLVKGRVRLLVYASDISNATRSRVLRAARKMAPQQITTGFTAEEIGSLMGRERIGVLGIIDQGFANALQTEWERLKGLDKNACVE